MIHKLSKHCCNHQKEELFVSNISNEVMITAHMIIGSSLFQFWQTVKEDLKK